MTLTAPTEIVRHRRDGVVVSRIALVEAYRGRVYVRALVVSGDEFARSNEPFRPVIDVQYSCTDPMVCEVTLGAAP